MRTVGRGWGVAGVLLAAVGLAHAQDGPRSSAVPLQPEGLPPPREYRQGTGSLPPSVGAPFPGTSWAEASPLSAPLGTVAQPAPNGAPECAPGVGGYGGQAAPPPVDQRSLLRRWLDHLQDCFLGYPEEFREPMLGRSVYAHYKTHVANAEAARMVLYQYDFVDGCGLLNPHGRERLEQIAAMLPRTFFPVVIEPCAPDLDESRRLAVLNELARCPFPIPPERVVVGRPTAIPLSGPEAVRI